MKGPFGIDWVTEFENGTYKHQTEPKHATLAITSTAVQRMIVSTFNDTYNLKTLQGPNV